MEKDFQNSSNMKAQNTPEMDLREEFNYWAEAGRGGGPETKLRIHAYLNSGASRDVLRIELMPKGAKT